MRPRGLSGCGQSLAPLLDPLLARQRRRLGLGLGLHPGDSANGNKRRYQGGRQRRHGDERRGIERDVRVGGMRCPVIRRISCLRTGCVWERVSGHTSATARSACERSHLIYNRPSPLGRRNQISRQVHITLYYIFGNKMSQIKWIRVDTPPNNIHFFKNMYSNPPKKTENRRAPQWP